VPVTTGPCVVDAGVEIDRLLGFDGPAIVLLMRRDVLGEDAPVAPEAILG
jgi:hypothetical protein